MFWIIEMFCFLFGCWVNCCGLLTVFASELGIRMTWLLSCCDANEWCACFGCLWVMLVCGFDLGADDDLVLMLSILFFRSISEVC